MIHETAVITPETTIGVNVSIGPYTVIEGTVSVGDNCRVGPHCHILGKTDIGEDTVVHAGAVIGDEPQDRSYSGQAGFTSIGKRCIIREYTTIHRGNADGTGTVIGDDVMLMAFVHIGHNSQVDDFVTMVNHATLGGHVHVGKRSFVSYNVSVHQFVRLGEYAMTTGNCRITQDLPPFCLLGTGDDVFGPNVVGLRRANFSRELRSAIRKSIKLYFFSGLNRDHALTRIQSEFGQFSEIRNFVTFIRDSKRGVLKGVAANRKHEDETSSPSTSHARRDPCDHSIDKHISLNNAEE